jgi:hypothetical protein
MIKLPPDQTARSAKGRPTAEFIFAAGVYVLAFVFGAIVIPLKMLPPGVVPADAFDTFLLFRAQDQVVAPLFIFSLLISIAFFRSSARNDWGFPEHGLWTKPVAIVVLSGVALLLGWLGRISVHHSFDLSMDEYIPAFQARIFLHGQLMAELPAAEFQSWEALQPVLLFYDTPYHLWASAYRPVFAAFRALFRLFNGEDFLNPAFAALSIWAIADVSKRIFPDLTEAPLCSALLLLLSPQFLLTAASGFAFSAHLALNLVWLSLFLRGTFWSHVLASVVGFLAIGLHQIVFHPLFAAPFLAALALGWFGKRSALIPYLVSYSIALAIWSMWWELSIWLQTGDASVLPKRFEDIAYFSNYFEVTAANRDVLADIALPLTLTNVYRYLLWLSPAVLPLSVVAFLRWRTIGLVPILCGLSVVLTIAATYFLMPNQVHSWGARYYHPVLGCTVMFAVAGYRALKKEAQQISPRPALAFLLAISAFVLLPWRAEQVDEKVGPRARVQQAIASLDSDYVVLNGRFWFGSDFVRNDPYLRNRPRIANSDILAAHSLIAGKKVIVLTQSDLVRMGLPAGTSLEPVR